MHEISICAHSVVESEEDCSSVTKDVEKRYSGKERRGT